MKKAIFTIITLFTLFSFNASAANTETTTATKEVNPLLSMPLAKTFWELFRKRTIVGQYDCSNKCGQYARLLRAEGFEADIVVIRPHTGRLLHAVVKLTEANGTVRYLDPTKGTTSYDLTQMGDLKETIAFADLEAQGEQYM